MPFVILFFSLSLGLSTANAQRFVEWTEKGNGGDAVVCQDASQNKMYDAYEAEARHGVRILMPPTLKPESKLNTFLSVLSAPSIAIPPIVYLIGFLIVSKNKVSSCEKLFKQINNSAAFLLLYDLHVENYTITVFTHKRRT